MRYGVAHWRRCDRNTEEAPWSARAWCGNREPTTASSGAKGLLLAVIAICAVAGIVSTAALGQTQAALAIGIVALAFFSRVGC